MRKNNEHRKNLIAIFLASLAVFTVLAYVASTPRPSEQFFQVYVLGSNHKLEHYYPDDDPNIPANTTVEWYTGVTNMMNSIQYVVVIFKLGNMSIPPPNETSATPSLAPILMQYSRILLQNETWEFPFTWKIVAENRSVDRISLTLNVNGTILYMPDPRNIAGKNFRIIVELWVYDPITDAMEFGWLTGSERKAAWLQVWFNATMAGP